MNAKKIEISTCHAHDIDEMNSIKDISIETVGVADYCPACKTSRGHAQIWEIEVDEDSMEVEHFDMHGSDIGRRYKDFIVIPNSARLLADRDRGEYGDWYYYD